MIRLLEFAAITLICIFPLLLIGHAGTPGDLYTTKDFAFNLINGIGITILIVTLWAYTGRSNKFIAFLLVATGLVISLIRLWPKRRKLIQEFPNAFVHLGASTLSAQLMYLTVGLSGSLYMRFLPFTNANNDMAAFIAGADNLNHSGFQEFWRVQYYGIASGTEREFTGASAMISFVSRLTHLETWRVAIPVMGIVTAATILILFELCRQLGIKSVMLKVVAVAWSLHAPLSATVQNDYFLSQGLARLFTLAQIVLITDYIIGKSHNKLRIMISIAITTSALLVSYSAGAGLCLLVTGMWLVFMVIGHSPRFETLIQSAFVFAGWAIGFIIMIPRWNSIIENIRFFSTPNITGWPARTMLPSVLFGTGPGFAKIVPAWIAALIIASVGVFVISSMLQKQWMMSTASSSALMLFGLISLLGSLGIRFGSTTYQTWKAWGTFQPLMIALVVVLAERGARHFFKGGPFVLTLLLLPVAAFAVYSSQDTYRDVTVVPSKELIWAASDPQLKEIPSIVVRFRPYFETMISSIILDVRNSQFGSDTYLGVSQPGGECVLGLKTLVDPSAPVLKRYGQVVLVGSKSCLTP
jgi:hypothetical protein